MRRRSFASASSARISCAACSSRSTLSIHALDQHAHRTALITIAPVTRVGTSEPPVNSATVTRIAALSRSARRASSAGTKLAAAEAIAAATARPIAGRGIRGATTTNAASVSAHTATAPTGNRRARPTMVSMLQLTTTMFPAVRPSARTSPSAAAGAAACAPVLRPAISAAPRRVVTGNVTAL